MKERPLLIPAVLCGGSGKRLWPLSRDSRPKQFLRLLGEHTLFQTTILRTQLRSDCGPIIAVANHEHRFVVAEQLRALNVVSSNIVLEPAGRNTCAAATVAAQVAMQIDPDAILLLMPSDHLIRNNLAFLAAIDRGLQAAAQGKLVLFGIEPDQPATGYGYIELGPELPTAANTYHVERFIEKPERPMAESYLATGRFVWNSGIFLLPAALFLEEVRTLNPQTSNCVELALANAGKDADFIRLEADPFLKAPSISIDCAIFEKTDRAAVVRVDMDWSDIGSWSAIWEAMDKDRFDNATFGKCISEQTTGSYLRSEGPLIAAIGLRDVVIVATNDVVLALDKAYDQDVKGIVERIREYQTFADALNLT